MKPDRCSARNVDGSPCQAQAWRNGRCRWHAPELAEERRAWSAKGGRARSNTSRARTAMRGDLTDLSTVRASLLRALQAVETGRMEPGVAAAMASLGRTLVTLAQAAAAVQFEEQLNRMAAELADLQRQRGAG